MASEVGIWVWPEIVLARGTQVTFTHWINGPDGASLIDPDHWYWMSSVADYDPYQNPNTAAEGTGVAVLEQYAYRAFQDPAAGNNAVWMATWKTTDGLNDVGAYFRPRMAVVPAI